MDSTRPGRGYTHIHIQYTYTSACKELMQAQFKIITELAHLCLPSQFNEQFLSLFLLTFDYRPRATICSLRRCRWITRSELQSFTQHGSWLWQHETRIVPSVGGQAERCYVYRSTRARAVDVPWPHTGPTGGPTSQPASHAVDQPRTLARHSRSSRKGAAGSALVRTSFCPPVRRHTQRVRAKKRLLCTVSSRALGLVGTWLAVELQLQQQQQQPGSAWCCLCLLAVAVVVVMK